MKDYQTLLICIIIYVLAYLLLPRGLVYFLFFFHVIFVPLLFKFCPAFRRKLVFANFVQWPINIKFNKPFLYNVKGGRNFYIEVDSRVDNTKIKIGVWHILPISSYNRLATVCEESIDKVMDRELAQSKRPIMMYCHGNSNSRAAPHRIKLYHRLQEMDFHIVALDYRGFGDSTNVALTEEGVVEDALATYNWILNKIEKSTEPPPVFIWGHSLGTGIASHLVGNLDTLSQDILNCTLPLPNGLILEAPFNNMADEVKHHPLSFLVQWLPYRIHTFVNPFKFHVTFRSDSYLCNVKKLPVLILHGKDDMVVPFILGLKLYRTILSSRTEKDAPVTLKAFERGTKLGHIWICNASELKTCVLEFCNTQCKKQEIMQH